MWNSKLILVDADNVLLDFNTSFYQWIEAEKNLTPTASYNTIYQFEKLYGTTLEEMADHIAEFSHSETFASLPPLEGSIEAIQRLRERGYTFEAITACHDSPEVRAARESALHGGYGITDIHYVGLGNDKFDILARYRPSFWVEDNLKNAMDGSMAGHYTFLIDYGYNRSSDKGIHRVKDWAEIESVLVEME